MCFVFYYMENGGLVGGWRLEQSQAQAKASSQAKVLFPFWGVCLQTKVDKWARFTRGGVQ